MMARPVLSSSLEVTALVAAMMIPAGLLAGWGMLLGGL